MKDLKMMVGHMKKNCLEKEVNEFEWRSIRLNHEVHYINRAGHENFLVKINQVAKILEVKKLAVVCLHTLPSTPDKTPGIIVQF